MDFRRQLPSVDQLLHRDDLISLQKEYGHDLVVLATQSVLDQIRQDAEAEQKILQGIDFPDLVQKCLLEWTSPTLVPVINASGVILHTNLGRAPLSAASVMAIQRAAHEYCTVEYDLSSGRRGSRTIHTADLLRRLTGAEDAVVVNNNAASVLLVLTALARRKQVAISRSQLVEIGGGFRIPEVLMQSGAHLMEIGTTNRVHLDDYLQALENGASIILHVHSSNFKVIGFTAEPDKSDLVALAHEKKALYIDDLGSGALLDTRRFGMTAEPMVQDAIRSGADIVCFSGDKLLGGPQAGIILGRKDLLVKIKKHPLYRALRADKICLAGLSATLLHYLKNEAETCIPVWRMIAEPVEEIRKRAKSWQDFLHLGELLESTSTVGGGSLPGETLPTVVLAIAVKSPERLLKKLRSAHTPVIARIENDQVVLDPRTVFPEQETQLLTTIKLLLETN